VGPIRGAGPGPSGARREALAAGPSFTPCGWGGTGKISDSSFFLCLLGGVVGRPLGHAVSCSGMNCLYWLKSCVTASLILE